MALVVRAKIIDIRSDAPVDADVFLVDTNVWYWIAYTRASQANRPPTQNQATHYPAYIAKALDAGAALRRCSLSLAELAHIIEKTEREIFQRTSNRRVATKEYRHDYPTERANVVAEIHAAWGQVKTLAVESVDVLIDDPTADAALAQFAAQPLDGYDVFTLGAALGARVVQIMTDDRDFATVPGITVFTANETVIAEATAQGMLATR
jgi:hypothetical protein